MDGETVVQHIRAEEHTLAAQSVPADRPLPTKILALTASAFGTVPEALLAIGCDDLLFKPISREPLLETLADHLNLRYCYSEPSPDPLQNPANPASATARVSLSATEISAGLAAMSPQWREQLRQAATQADDQQILTLLSRLPAAQQDIQQQMTELVRHFRFDMILSLAQSSSP
jgi:CheY-like chemotaxis protein